MKKDVVFLFILILFIQFISASGLALTIEVSPSTLNLNHGESEKVRFTVSNNQNYCPIKCDWEIYEVTGGVKKKQGNVEVKAGQDFFTEIEFIAPSKEAKQESGVTEYEFRVSCQEKEGWYNFWYCNGEDSDNEKAYLVMNIDLTEEEKQARDYIRPKLEEIKNNLKNIEQKDVNLKAKLNGLPKNILIEDLKNSLEEYYSSFVKYKGSYEKINDLQGKLYFIEAKNELNYASFDYLDTLVQNYENLEENIEARIVLHNRVSDELNKLGEKNTKLSELCDIAKCTNSVGIEINNLIGNFKGGSFDSYKYIEGRISSLNIQLDSMIKKAEEEINEINKEGIKFLEKEEKEICGKYGICLENIATNNNREICNNLKLLKTKVSNENSKRLNEYEKLKLEKEQQNTEEPKKEENVGFFQGIINFFLGIFGLLSDKPITGSTIKEPTNIELSRNANNYLSKNCGNVKDYEIETIQGVENIDPNIDVSSEIKDIEKKENICCVFGKCEKCCEGNECYEHEESYPLIFLHGHALSVFSSTEYSLDSFNKIINKLSEEGFRNGGIILPNLPESYYTGGEWGKVRVPIVLKTTYYYNVYNEEGKLINKPSKIESINTYSERLGDIIEIVKKRSNRKKVNIIAHSMGGLVARNYIKNYGGEDSINKLIMIGTPNHGVYGQVDSWCDVPLLGAHVECRQMASDSSFINSLNSDDETYGDVEYYTIAGSGCFEPSIDGDGISRVESVKLDGANNVVIKKAHNECANILDRDLHSNLLDPDLYPQTYDYIKEFLKE